MAPDVMGTRGLVVHEWIEQVGGAEKVLEAVVESLPVNEVACLWNDAPGRFTSATVSESWMARTPLRRSKVAALPLMPLTWKAFPRANLDWAFVSSHLFAHHAVGLLDDTPTLVYAHTPARYIWDPSLDPRGRTVPARLAAPFLKRIDRAAVRPGKTTVYLANSAFVRSRVERAWGVEATVLYPPVDVPELPASNAPDLSAEEQRLFDALPSEYLLAASRLVRYKSVDFALQVAERARTPIVVAGSGPDHDRLKALAETLTVDVIFLGRVPDQMLRLLYRRAIAYVFPAVEDFGIMPVEAMAVGARVIVNDTGGTAETVEDGVSGAHFRNGDLASAVDAVGKVQAIERNSAIRRAQLFSKANFQASLERQLRAIL